MKLHEIKQLNEGHLYNDPAFTHFTDRKEILAFLRDNIMSKITARDVKIHSDGTTDILLPPSKHIKFVKGSFLALHKLPVKFGTVSCTFVITGLGLHTLENCPIEIVGNFVADNNKLVDLKFSPKVVAGNYSVRENRLTSLDGCTKSVGGEFDCSANDLKTIAGGPTFVDGDYEVSDNYLTMLDCKAVHVNGNVNVRGNPLKSIDGLEEAFTSMLSISFDAELVKFSLLPLINFKNLNLKVFGGSVPAKAIKILNKYLGKPDQMFECQSELIEAGFERYT